MNPNLNTHMGIPHPHQGSHSSSQLQPSAPSLHSLHHTQLHAPHTHSHPSQPHLPPHYQHQLQQPSSLEPHATSQDSIDPQQANIARYKSSAKPAYDGYIETTHDALIIFSACSGGHCPKVTRRLHERERRSITSGSVYVFDEAEAGIKRWTDGRLWSPSRILNNFLVYREIDQKRPTASTNASSTNNSNDQHNDQSSNNANPNLTLGDHHHLQSASSNSLPPHHHHHPSAPSRPATPSHQHQSSPKPESRSLSSLESKPILPQDGQDQSRPTNSGDQSQTVPARRPINRERERALVGSLTSTYKFRPDGLVKKTISLGGMHMISYYKMEDVLSGRLRAPKTQEMFRQIAIDPRFLHPPFFRCPPSWGVGADGNFWIQDESPEEPSPISSSSNTSPFQNAQRSAVQSLAKPQSTVSNAIQGVRGSLLQPHASTSERLLPSALSRPSSSSSSTGSPSATSPVSPNTFPLLAGPNLSTQSGPISRPGANSSTRYEPYPKLRGSPPLPVSSTTTNNNLTDQKPTVSYYSPNQSNNCANGYATQSFLPDSNSTSLVTSERNTRPDSAAHNSRNLDSFGQVAYGDSGSYRTHTTTTGGSESMYGQYTSADTTNNSNRSASVPPSPYGLPSINRLRGSGQPGSTSSSNTDSRGIGEYQFSASPTQQQQTLRLPSPNLSHGGSYGAYLSPIPTEFRCHTGGSNLSGRDNNHYNTSQQASMNNHPSGQTSSVSGTQSPTFLYPSPPTSTTATSFSSTYQFPTNMINQQPQSGNTSRRGSGAGTFGNEVDRDNNEGNNSGSRLSGLNRIPSRLPQRNENENTASHWGTMGSSHIMKTEDGGN